MAKKFKYETELIKGSQNFVYAEFPFDCRQEFGSRKAIRVKVSFDNEPSQMSLMPRGNGNHWLVVRKEIRDKIGKQEGDTVFVVLEKDDSIRTIPIPDYLQWLFDEEPEMGKVFQKLSSFYQKFWVNGIEETKNEDTKVERINKLFAFLRSGGKSGI